MDSMDQRGENHRADLGVDRQVHSRTFRALNRSGTLADLADRKHSGTQRYP